MTLPNAHAGVQKLFIAEILSLIGVLLALIAIGSLGAVYGMYTAVGHETAGMGGLAIGGVLSLIGVAILPIISLILTLVGLRQASKDEPDRMNKAFWCAVWALILSVIAGVFQGLGWIPLYRVCSFISSILQICMIVFSIMGVSEVTQNISRQDVADLGPKIIVIAVVAMVLSLIATIINNFVGGVFAIVAMVCMLVAYIVYVVFLARATGALARG